MKDEKGVSIVDAFQNILGDSDRKPNKIWVDNGSEFYNNSLKKWLKDNDTEMYLIHNERKSVVSERFIKTLETKIYKYMTLVSKNVYIDKLNDIVVEYNSTYHRKIKMLILRKIHILILRNKLMIKILNLKFAIM